uniref:Putative bovine pancreatic trypsin inhibitor n=1 Tax=Rhipicephalus microplus TaxID=6941 RepID=A0A6G5A9P6_RHIMP|nr:uncharacterized protein LOC119168091 [Rhipicephalus microplus]
MWFLALFVTILPFASPAYFDQQTEDARDYQRNCATPLMEEVRFCGELRIWRYFYNKTSNRCERFFWDNCLDDGVHVTRIDCARKCNHDERPEICAQRPAASCKENRRHSKYRPPMGYSYNIRTLACEQYRACWNLGYLLKKNWFPSKTLCLMHCRGFTMNGIITNKGLEV